MPSGVTIVRIAGAIFLLYLLSQAGVLRWVRDQMRASVVGPTPEQVRAAADAPPPIPVLPPRNPVVRKAWMSEPPSNVTVAGAIASIIAASVIVMFLTGRAPARDKPNE